MPVLSQEIVMVAASAAQNVNKKSNVKKRINTRLVLVKKEQGALSGNGQYAAFSIPSRPVSIARL